jgi:signal transduction histidine kinase/CheY-like chemotaxis protein
VDEKIDHVNNFLDSLSLNNTDTAVQRLINRLNVLARGKKLTKEKLLNRYLTIGNMDDTSTIANPRARRISDEITITTAKIYESRRQLMMTLSRESEQMGNKARLYDISLLVLLLVSGAVICIFIVRQFRKQHLLIAELNESEQKASVAAQAKENFLANMSHEIRTPLSGILGFTNLLQKRPLDTAAAEFVSSIQKSGENLMTIINDILDLSKIEAGMMRITPGTFSVNGLVHSIETLFGERVKEKGLRLTSTIDSSIPDTLTGDATRLTQILVNLISNAIKFTQQGSITIEVYNKGRSNDSILLGFKVNDTGIGIDKKKLGEIFDRFNQGEDSITRNYGGTGLGLSIVKNLILLQNGNIEVSSEQGKGTSFNFYIPYGIAEKQLQELPTTAVTSPGEPSNMPFRILVVDDNVTNQSLMKHLLQEWHVSFDIVSNGLEALQSLQSTVYALVLMDIQMPQMDGYTATQQIREVLKLDIPVIAMTAHAMAGEREKCLSRGMNEYISKPINEQELLKLISKFGFSNIKQPELSIPVARPAAYQYIDLTYLQSVSGGKKGFEDTVTRQFIENVPQHLQQLYIAFHTCDFATVHLVAHDLKSSVAIMGLLSLLENRLDQLESAIEKNETLEQVLHEINAIASKAVAEAKDFYATLHS